MHVESPGGQPERQTQVWGEIGELESSVTRMGTAIDKLASRLAAILTEPTPNKEAEARDSISVVALAGSIRGSSHKITTMTTFMDSLIERLEL